MTGRATVLVLVLGALVLAYAYPVRIYLNQQAQIAALESNQVNQQQHIKDLRAEAAKWQDDEYVKAQAKRRLQMVLPGDTVFIPVQPSSANTAASTDPDAGTAKATGPWYGQLWSSVQAADKPRPET
jgi:cell division protein FtsB